MLNTSSSRPESMTNRTGSWLPEDNRSFCLTLLPMGFTQPARSPEPLVRSYRTVSPLPLKNRERFSDWRFAFCCTFPILADGGRYPPSCPAEPGLSSEPFSPANTLLLCQPGHCLQTSEIRNTLFRYSLPFQPTGRRRLPSAAHVLPDC